MRRGTKLDGTHARYGGGVNRDVKTIPPTERYAGVTFN
jgi:hypothetical protein